jgi:hypothetical protein
MESLIWIFVFRPIGYWFLKQAYTKDELMLTSTFYILYFLLHSVSALQRIRSDFVQRVSSAVIKGLLDDLLAQGVFSTEEKATVTQANRITQDQARCVIDTVIGKGEESSGIMIDCLLRRDRHLCRQLVLIASDAMGEL